MDLNIRPCALGGESDPILINVEIFNNVTDTCSGTCVELRLVADADALLMM